MPVGGKARHDRIDDLAHDAKLQRVVDERAGRERAHASGIWSFVAVEHAFVILRGHQRRRAGAVAQREERDLRPVETFLEHDARASLAELPALPSRHEWR